MSEPKKLYRSRTDRMIGGVCGGVAKTYGWDPTLVRVGYVFLSVFSTLFPGIVVYLILWIIIPEEPSAATPNSSSSNDQTISQ